MNRAGLPHNSLEWWDGAGAVIPFKITGTQENPPFGLDFRKPR